MSATGEVAAPATGCQDMAIRGMDARALPLVPDGGTRAYGRRSYPVHRGVPYFRASHPIHYQGVACSSACYLGAGGTYHHPSCPLVSHHFRRHGYDPYRTIHNYAPRYGPGYGQGVFSALRLWLRQLVLPGLSALRQVFPRPVSLLPL